jgi:hypothetical protein
VDKALAEKRKIMGIGHAVYKTEDPACHLARAYSKEMADKRARPSGTKCRSGSSSSCTRKRECSRTSISTRHRPIT